MTSTIEPGTGSPYAGLGRRFLALRVDLVKGVWLMAVTGHRLVGIRVVRSADGAGRAASRPPGIGRSLVRNALRLVDGLPLNLTGVVLILRSPERARLGDRLARTRVVVVPPGLGEISGSRDYLNRKKRMLRSWARSARWARAELHARYGETRSADIVRNARRAYEDLIPRIPCIGGARNRWSRNLVESVELLSLCLAMRKSGAALGEIEDVVRSGMLRRLSHYPRAVLRLLGRLQFSRAFVRSLDRQARETQKRTYPENFVAEIVASGDGSFDWGIDFTECAIQKLFRMLGVSEYLPLICRLDHLSSDAFGLGMVRTETLAEGGTRCNPRLKRVRACPDRRRRGS